MRVNKIFGVKSITNLIYGMLLLLPMVSILSRVIYTQANPNAKDSYSNYVESTNVKLQNADVVFSGQLITISRNNVNTLVDGQQFYILDNQTNFHQALNTGYTFTIDRINLIIENGRIRLQFFDTSNNQYNVFKQLDDYWSFWLVNKNDISIGSENYYYNVFLSSFTSATLDNVFEFSLNTFLDDYDNQSIDFFSWFTNLFLNQSNSRNALYLNFCNWYMNYVLLVSSAYLLFFALMWFINYVRKILEKSSYHDFGGF